MPGYNPRIVELTFPYRYFGTEGFVVKLGIPSGIIMVTAIFSKQYVNVTNCTVLKKKYKSVSFRVTNDTTKHNNITFKEWENAGRNGPWLDIVDPKKTPYSARNKLIKSPDVRSLLMK